MSFFITGVHFKSAWYDDRKDIIGLKLPNDSLIVENNTRPPFTVTMPEGVYEINGDSFSFIYGCDLTYIEEY